MWIQHLYIISYFKSANLIPTLTSSLKYYYYWRPIRDLSETHRRPTCLIRDRHALSENHRRPRHASSKTHMSDWRPIGVLNMFYRRLTCLIRDRLETNMPDWRLTGDRHAWRVTSTYFIGDRHAWSVTHRRPQHASLVTHLKPTCPIAKYMPNWRHIGDWHA